MRSRTQGLADTRWRSGKGAQGADSYGFVSLTSAPLPYRTASSDALAASCAVVCPSPHSLRSLPLTFPTECCEVGLTPCPGPSARTNIHVGHVRLRRRYYLYVPGHRCLSFETDPLFRLPLRDVLLEPRVRRKGRLLIDLRRTRRVVRLCFYVFISLEKDNKNVDQFRMRTAHPELRGVDVRASMCSARSPRRVDLE